MLLKCTTLILQEQEEFNQGLTWTTNVNLVTKMLIKTSFCVQSKNLMFSDLRDRFQDCAGRVYAIAAPSRSTRSRYTDRFEFGSKISTVSTCEICIIEPHVTKVFVEPDATFFT